MAVAQTNQPDIDLLELIRKQVFGNNINTPSFDFNSIFSSSPFGSAADIDSSGSDPGPNPSIGNADPAIGSAMANLGMTAALGLVGVPGLSTVVGQVTGNSTLSNAKTLLAALGIISEQQEAFGIADNAQQAISLAQSENEAIGFANSANEGIGVDGISGANPGEDGEGIGGIGDTGDAAPGDSYHAGGFISGGPPGSEIDIKAKVGEFVVPNDIVNMLGRNFFEKMLLTESPLQVAAEKAAKEQAAKSRAK